MRDRWDAAVLAGGFTFGYSAEAGASGWRILLNLAVAVGVILVTAANLGRIKSLLQATIDFLIANHREVMLAVDPGLDRPFPVRTNQLLIDYDTFVNQQAILAGMMGVEPVPWQRHFREEHKVNWIEDGF